MASFLRNAWYMAAWSDEIGGTPLARRLLDLPVVLFRTGQGVRALLDRCPHRFAPLSRGRVEADRIACGYHGLAFNGDGQCVRNPFSDKLPDGAAVRAFPIVERDGIVWLWPGEAGPPAARKPPPIGRVADGTVHGYTHMRANYELGTDNLMDLSHIEFLHTRTFAGAGVMFSASLCVASDAEGIEARWSMPDVPVPPWARTLADAGTRLDHWLSMRWWPPSCMRLVVGLAWRDGSGRRLERVQAHVLTPETESASHYFWGVQADPGPEGDAAARSRLGAAFDGEDKPMIEAVQESLGSQDFWAAKPAILPVDVAALRVRRRLRKLILAEQGRGDAGAPD